MNNYPDFALDAGKILQIYADFAADAKRKANENEAKELKFFYLGAFDAYMHLYNALKLSLQDHNINVVENIIEEPSVDG